MYWVGAVVTQIFHTLAAKGLTSSNTDKLYKMNLTYPDSWRIVPHWLHASAGARLIEHHYGKCMFGGWLRFEVKEMYMWFGTWTLWMSVVLFVAQSAEPAYKYMKWSPSFSVSWNQTETSLSLFHKTNWTLESIIHYLFNFFIWFESVKWLEFFLQMNCIHCKCYASIRFEVDKLRTCTGADVADWKWRLKLIFFFTYFPFYGWCSQQVYMYIRNFKS